MAAMQRLLTSLVFCEAPMDLAYGAPAGTGATTKLAADAGEVPSRPTEEAANKAHRVAVIKPAQRLMAECAPAFDGLHCFETVVMPARSGH